MFLFLECLQTPLCPTLPHSGTIIYHLPGYFNTFAHKFTHYCVVVVKIVYDLRSYSGMQMSRPEQDSGKVEVDADRTLMLYSYAEPTAFCIRTAV